MRFKTFVLCLKLCVYVCLSSMCWGGWVDNRGSLDVLISQLCPLHVSVRNPSLCNFYGFSSLVAFLPHTFKYCSFIVNGGLADFLDVLGL